MNLVLVALLVMLSSPPPPKPRPWARRAATLSLSAAKRSGDILGAPCTALVEGRGDSTATARVLDAAWEEMARLGDVLDASRLASELSRLNAEAGAERFACSADLYAAIDSAMDAAEDTGGIFDPTIGPLTRAWDVHGAGRVPAADEIAATRRQVGWRAVAREPGGRVVRFTRPGMGLDLDGIARGYALDRAAASLREHGIARALLSLGDQSIALSNREPWQVAIRLPSDAPAPGFRVALTNGALATVATSDRGGAAAGVRRDVVLDPRTGMPLRGEASISVVTRSGSRAGAIAEALLVMGRERAAAFVAGHGGIGGLWLEPTSDGVRAWAWSLPAVAAEPGINVVWMTPR